MAQIEIIPDSIKLVRMTDTEYFSEDFGGYVSNSKLGLINPAQDGSVEKYKKGFEDKFSESFELGTAVHCMVLQPDDFFISKLEKPTGKLGLFVGEVLKARISGLSIADSIDQAKIKANYYAASLTPKRLRTAMEKGLDYYLKRGKSDDDKQEKEPIYLSAPMKEKFMKCMSAISADQSFLDLLRPQGLLEATPTFNEYAILCDVNVILDDETVHKVKLKAKLDNFTIDHEMKELTLNDLKTTGKPARFFMGNRIKEISETGEEKKIWINGSFQKYHYYRQMGMYLWLLNAAMLNLHGPGYTLNANMLLVETIPNFKTKIYKVNGNYIQRGLEEFKDLLIKVIEWTR